MLSKSWSAIPSIQHVGISGYNKPPNQDQAYNQKSPQRLSLLGKLEPVLYEDQKPNFVEMVPPSVYPQHDPHLQSNRRPLKTTVGEHENRFKGAMKQLTWSSSCPRSTTASHTRTVLSRDPETMREPSGENATDATKSV